MTIFRFFLQEIQAGEALISSGDIEQGVTHLANAVVVCGQPTQLLQVSSCIKAELSSLESLEDNESIAFFYNKRKICINIKFQFN